MLALILSNLLPIVGILFLDWKTFPIFLFYCIEVGIGACFSLIELYRTDYSAKIFKIMMIFIVIPFWILVPMIFIFAFAITRVDNAVQTVNNFYFIASTVIMIVTTIFAGLKGSYRHVTQDTGFTFWNQFLENIHMFSTLIKILVVLVLTFMMVYNKIYTSVLVALALVKTFFDLRAFLKRQAPAKAEEDWVSFKTKDEIAD